MVAVVSRIFFVERRDFLRVGLVSVGAGVGFFFVVTGRSFFG